MPGTTAPPRGVPDPATDPVPVVPRPSARRLGAGVTREHVREGGWSPSALLDRDDDPAGETASARRTATPQPDEVAGASRPRPGPTGSVRWERAVRVQPLTRLGEKSEPLAEQRRRWERAYVRRLVVLDALAAATAGAVALLAEFGAFSQAPGYRIAAALFPLGWVAALTIGHAYQSRYLGVGGEEYRRVFDSAVRVLAAISVLVLAVGYDPARGFVVLIFPLTAALTLLGRYVSRRLLHRARSRGRYRSRVIVVGRERAISEMLGRLRGGTAYEPVGACVDRSSGPTVDGVPVVGSSHQIVEALRATGADTVAVAAWSDLSQEDLRRLSWRLEGTGVDLLVAPSLTDIAGPRVTIRPEAGVPLLHIDEPVFEGPQRVLKGALDRVLAGLGVLAVLPLLVAVTVLVRLDSPGPAFFRQVRVGVDGRTFTIFKFRTMYTDAEARLAELADRNEAGDGLLFKMRDDPRITRVGKVLRRFSIDELPQLANVVAGSMSLVGPRPPLPREVDSYDDDVRRRLLVRPGVTGLWQISGRSDLAWDEAVRLDLHYVENWSPMLDLVILYRTVGAVLASRGAY